MEVKHMNIGTVEEQQAVFGPQDQYIRIIEKLLCVSVVSRDSELMITGEAKRNIELAADVLTSMINLRAKGEEMSGETIHRLVEEAADGNLAETCRAVGDAVVLNNRGMPIRCKTIGQKNYIKALRENDITICIGPAGTGKTYLAVAQAARELTEGVIDRIIMSRPAIEAGEERLGFLPGDLAQKVDPYLRPLYDALYDIFGADKVAKMRERGIIEIAPLAYMRGRTLNRARVLVDESQNASLPTLKMALTRLGEGSKMVLTGDITQIDLPNAERSGLERCAEIVGPIEGISVIHLNNRDVVRNRLVKDIVRAFEKLDSEKKPAHSNPYPSKNHMRSRSRNDHGSHREP